MRGFFINFDALGLHLIGMSFVPSTKKAHETKGPIGHLNRSEAIKIR